MAAPTTNFQSSVSLLHNNLALSTNGWLAAAHNSVNAGHGKIMLHHMPSSTTRDGPEVNQATSVRFLDLGFGVVLCVSTPNGTNLYSEDGTTMLFHVTLVDPSQDAEVLKHHQGVCFVAPSNHIVLGLWKGSITTVHVTALDRFQTLQESAPQSQTVGISDLCYAACVNRVVTAHHNGEIRYWYDSQNGGQYANDVIIPPSLYQAPVHVSSLGPRLVVAFGQGTIVLYDAASRDCQIEISAHARWLTGVSIREDLSAIASVGEDTALNVWQIDAATGQVGLRHSCIVSDKLLTGVAFHGTGCAVTAYDTDEIFQVAVP
jgi:WD40 repeat protein